MSEATTSHDRSTAWTGCLLAPLVAGAVAALSNLTLFVAPRGTYFVVWGIAHLLAFGFGLWAVRVWQRPSHASTYVWLGAAAGAFETLIVFGVLDGLTIAEGLGMGGTLETGVEDYLAVAATILLFTAGAFRGARRLHAPDEDSTGTRGASSPRVPTETATQWLSIVAPAVALVAEIVKFA